MAIEMVLWLGLLRLGLLVLRYVKWFLFSKMVYGW